MQDHELCLSVAGSQSIEHMASAPALPVTTLTVLHQFGAQPQGIVTSVPTLPSQISQPISHFTNSMLTQQQIPVQVLSFFSPMIYHLMKHYTGVSKK
jgi:hypothetical protein